MGFRTESKPVGSYIRIPLLSLSSFVLAVVVGVVSSFTYSTAYDLILAALYGASQPVYGVWHGSLNGVHAVTIRLEQNGERVDGTARFSKIACTLDGPKVVGESEALALVNTRLDGGRLSFEVYGVGESGKTMAVMEMNFVGAGEAELRRIGGVPESETEGEEMVIRMKREPSF